MLLLGMYCVLRRGLPFQLLCSLIVGLPLSPRAEAASAGTVYEAPIGGAAIPLPTGYVNCASVDVGGWTLKRGERQVTPPSGAATDEVGRSIATTIGRSLSDCTNRAESLQLIAIRPLPKIDPKSAVVFLDEGRLEIGGRLLEGLQIQWSIGDHHGEGTCLTQVDPRLTAKLVWSRSRRTSRPNLLPRSYASYQPGAPRMKVGSFSTRQGESSRSRCSNLSHRDSSFRA